MKKNKVAVIWGEAAIDAPGKITVKAGKSEAPKGALGPGAYQAKHIIVATGARPRVLPGLEPDKKLVWTYFEAMVPDTMPKSLLGVGSGAIGIEVASFYLTLGAEVTVIAPPTIILGRSTLLSTVGIQRLVVPVQTPLGVVEVQVAAKERR